jgi:uncharacterized protein YndB with AHSA1/START domain
VDDLVLNRVITLRCSPAHAFHVFTEMTDLWWPRGHRRTAEATMVLEAAAGGRLLERSPDGSEWLLGRITVFEAPHRISFDWFPGSPTSPTSVDATFRATAGGSEIEIVHRALSEGAVAAWPDKVALFARGWDTVLPAMADFIEKQQATA